MMSSECSFRDESKWEVVVSSTIGIDRAEHVLNNKLNQDGKLHFDVYEHVSSQFICSADDGEHSQSHSLNHSSDFQLSIGMALNRNVVHVKYTTMQTTIGAFFMVKDKIGQVCTCAFTNWECTSKKSDCSVINGRNSIPVGEVLMSLEGNIPISNSNSNQAIGACAGGSDESSILTNIYHDAMLVDVSAGNLYPSNDIMVRKCKSNLLPKIFDKPIICDSNFENERIAKINSEITGQPDGCIRSTKLSFRDKDNNDQYCNVIGITPKPGESGEISERGECGTLIGSVPGRGDHYIYVYGSIFGSVDFEKKDKRGNKIMDSYTAVFPMCNLIPQLLKKYPIYDSIQLLPYPETNTRKGENSIN